MLMRVRAIVFGLAVLCCGGLALASQGGDQSATPQGNPYVKKAYFTIGAGMASDNWSHWLHYRYAPIGSQALITHINHQWNVLAAVGLGYYFNKTFAVQLDYLKPFDNGWDYQQAGKTYHSAMSKYVVDLMAHVAVPIYKAFLYAGFGVAIQSQSISQIEHHSRLQVVPAIEFGDYYYLNSHVGMGLSYKHLFNVVSYTSSHYMPASDYVLFNLIIK